MQRGNQSQGEVDVADSELGNFSGPVDPRQMNDGIGRCHSMLQATPGGIPGHRDHLDICVLSQCYFQVLANEAIGAGDDDFHRLIFQLGRSPGDELGDKPQLHQKCLHAFHIKPLGIVRVVIGAAGDAR